MQVIKLILDHFKGIVSGRGKDRVEIDFSSLNTNAQLVAISGPNGSCKTTLIDNMHPFRVMPSRATSPTPTSFSFYEEIVVGKDALKDITWSHKGRVFQSIVRIRSTGKTKKQECYLTEKVNGVFAPYTDSTGLTSDGKTDTYDQAVEAILGKPEVFFATQFSAQGKKPISTMTAGEVKALMSSMLTMGSFKLLSEKSSEVVKGLKPHLSAFQSQLLPLETAVFRLPALIDQKSVVSGNREVNSSKITRQRAVVRDLTEQLASLKTKIEQQDALVAQRASLALQLDSVAVQNSQQLSGFVTRQAQDRTHSLEAQCGAVVALRVAETAVSNAKTLIAQTIAILATEGAIEKAKAFHNTNKTVLSELRLQETDLYVDAKKFDELTLLVANLRESFSAGCATGVALKEAIEAAQAIAALIGEVPCQGHAFSASCKLLADANRAATELPVKQAQRSTLRTTVELDKVRLNNSGAELQRLTNCKEQKQVLMAKISALELQLSDARATLRGEAALIQAKSDITAQNQALASAEADYQVALQNRAKADESVQNIVSKQAVDKSNFEAVLYREKIRLTAALDSMPLPVNSNELQRVSQMLEEAEFGVQNLETERENLTARLNAVEGELNEALLAKVKIAQTVSSCDFISAEISGWTLLSKAMGNDGIIAMSIDDAGPEISELCNSLLHGCAGGRFNISLSTQATTAAGALKEAFLINVEDTLRGETKELSKMSGGEKVWINESLVRAMALYMAQSTKSDFKTLFSDEADGPLDPERKRQYMAMKRSVLERGGYEREYIITQTPELLNMVDEVIDVTTL